jgi:hypothetical protein
MYLSNATVAVFITFEIVNVPCKPFRPNVSLLDPVVSYEKSVVNTVPVTLRGSYPNL